MNIRLHTRREWKKQSKGNTMKNGRIQKVIKMKINHCGTLNNRNNIIYISNNFLQSFRFGLPGNNHENRYQASWID